MTGTGGACVNPCRMKQDRSDRLRSRNSCRHWSVAWRRSDVQLHVAKRNTACKKPEANQIAEYAVFCWKCRTARKLTRCKFRLDWHNSGHSISKLNLLIQEIFQMSSHWKKLSVRLIAVACLTSIKKSMKKSLKVEQCILVKNTAQCTFSTNIRGQISIWRKSVAI